MGRHGEGTVYRRRDGRWSGQIRNLDGKRQTVYGLTEEEAHRRLAAICSTIGRDSDPFTQTNTIPDLEKLRRQRAAIRRLVRSERASNVRVFGSVARGDSTAGSDYDLVVDLDPEVRGFEAFDRLDRLERQLARLLGGSVHVVTARHDSGFTRRVLRDAIGL
jgi:predicted nucleotidyltransferase